MKKIVFILLFSFVFLSEYSDKYYKSMDRALDLFNSSKTEQDYIKASNYFYRISQAVQTDWISSYYYALCNTRISIFQDDNDIKEIYLDKAFDIIAPFDSVATDSLAHSEIHTLKALIYVAKIFINPMINGMKYGPMSGKSIEKAIRFYSTNPRPYFLDGQSKYYTPSAFGGGIDKAIPILEKSVEYYDKFEAKKYWPDWGREDCQILYTKALNEKE